MKKITALILLIFVMTSGCSRTKNINYYNDENNTYTDNTIENTPENCTVYITQTGKCYHNENCRYLRNSSIETKIEKATIKNYKPCSVCVPKD